MNYFRKIYLRYENRGITHVAHYLLKKIGIKTKYSSFLHKKKSDLDNRIFKQTNGIVNSGIYKSLILTKDSNWNIDYDADIGSKLLGFYEEQVQKKIIELKTKYNLKYLVNFGSAEGYHAIGLLKNNHFEECLCFETSSLMKKIMLINATLNKVEKKISFFGNANFNDVVKKLTIDKLKKTLFLTDIEGGEFTLYNKENLSIFKNSFHIIENHEEIFREKNKVRNFYTLMDNHFKKEILKNGERNPFDIKGIEYFPDDDRWLLMSEGRPCEMNWLVYIPQV